MLMRSAVFAFVAALGLHHAVVARQVPVSSYTTLRDACQNALPGDTIVVAAGTYTITGASRIMISGRPGPVLLRGATGNPQDVVIRGQGQDNNAVQMVFNLDNAPAWTFRDITVKDSYYHGFKFDHASTDCALIRVVMRDHGESGVKGTSDPTAGSYPDRLLIDSCDIGFTQPTGGTRSVVEGVDGVGVNDWVIRNSRFVNVQKNGAPAYAIFTKGNSSNTVIENNRFENCFIGASFGGGGTGAQFFRDNDQTYEHRNGIIRNNLIIRCTDAGVYINKGVNCRIYNNTLFECVLTIQLRFSQSSGDVRNNLVLRAPSNPSEPVVRLRDGAVLLGSGANLAASTADFVQSSGSPAQLDLHLAASSQAIDAGNPLPVDVPFDFEGQRRPAGSGWDVGADELGLIPVELRTFSAVLHDNGVLLRWRTETETENFGFEVQRAVGNAEFEVLGFEPGNGTAAEAREYTFLDTDALAVGSSRRRYRLRQIDFNGSSVLGPVIEVRSDGVELPLSLVSLAVWPNPASGLVRASIESTEQGTLWLHDVCGREFHEWALEPGTQVISIPLPKEGVFYLVAQCGAARRVLTVIAR
ncbi:MAG: right-handed parallel beta-helix repeat-containing protein [Bacteroidia bacterium]|nr:right-handed parallel beta-helix repeat-containing protein [Bacteroidia bacterium]